MTHAELRRKFDEIVAFAEVERFLDTPVKRYSSGMYVRLAFAVAAHIEPEILIVDEVLAVGDAAFQKKCLGRMSEASAPQAGRCCSSATMSARFCRSAIPVSSLDQGRVIMRGPIQQEVVRGYADRQRDRAVDIAGFVGPLKALRFEAFLLNGAPLLGRNSVTSDSDIVIEMMGEARRPLPISNLRSRSSQRASASSPCMTRRVRCPPARSRRDSRFHAICFGLTNSSSVSAAAGYRAMSGPGRRAYRDRRGHPALDGNLCPRR